MERRHLTLLSSLALLTALVATPAASARGGDGAGPLFKGEMKQAKLAHRLGLDESQRARSQAIIDEARAEVRALAETLVETQAKLRAMKTAEAFDEDAVRALARQRADATVELTVLKARVRSELSAVLTADQREALSRMKHERRRGHGKHRRGQPED